MECLPTAKLNSGRTHPSNREAKESYADNGSSSGCAVGTSSEAGSAQWTEFTGKRTPQNRGKLQELGVLARTDGK